MGLIHVAGTWHNADGRVGKVVLDASVWAVSSGRTTTDNIVAVTLPIALFLTTGFEHSVANMFLIPLGILISDTAGAGFWTDARIDASSYSGPTWESFLVDNLIPVTLGNIVGGGVMIGVMYWPVFHHIDRPVRSKV